MKLDTQTHSSVHHFTGIGLRLCLFLTSLHLHCIVNKIYKYDLCTNKNAHEITIYIAISSNHIYSLSELTALRVKGNFCPRMYMYTLKVPVNSNPDLSLKALKTKLAWRAQTLPTLIVWREKLAIDIKIIITLNPLSHLHED